MYYLFLLILLATFLTLLVIFRNTIENYIFLKNTQIPKNKSICSLETNLVSPQNKNDNNIQKKWAILLTTAINSKKNVIENKERETLYIKQIKRWLSDTNLDIFVVESTGVGFNSIPPHPRLKIITIKSPPGSSTSQSEAKSMKEAIKHIPGYFNYILKVTGRYFLKDIETHLQNVQDVDIVLQKHCNEKIKWQNSEYYGGKREIISKIVDMTEKIGLMEENLYKFFVENKLAFQRIGPFPNDVRRGGDNLLIKYL